MDQITALQKTLHASREPRLQVSPFRLSQSFILTTGCNHDLQEIYTKTEDNRRLAAAGKLAEDLKDLEALWADEKKSVEEHPQLHDVVRDGKCHEAVMWCQPPASSSPHTR